MAHERVSNRIHRREKHRTYGALFGVSLWKDKKWFSTVHKRRAMFTWKGPRGDPFLHRVQWVLWAVLELGKLGHGQRHRVREITSRVAGFEGGRTELKTSPSNPLNPLHPCPLPSPLSNPFSTVFFGPHCPGLLIALPLVQHSRSFSWRSFQMKPRAASRSPRRSKSEVWAAAQGKSFSKRVPEPEVLGVIPAEKSRKRPRTVGTGAHRGCLRTLRDSWASPVAEGPGWESDSSFAPFSPTGWLGNQDTLRVIMENNNNK